MPNFNMDCATIKVHIIQIYESISRHSLETESRQKSRTKKTVKKMLPFSHGVTVLSSAWGLFNKWATSLLLWPRPAGRKMIPAWLVLRGWTIANTYADSSAKTLFFPRTWYGNESVANFSEPFELCVFESVRWRCWLGFHDWDPFLRNFQTLQITICTGSNMLRG